MHMGGLISNMNHVSIRAVRRSEYPGVPVVMWWAQSVPPGWDRINWSANIWPWHPRHPWGPEYVLLLTNNFPLTSYSFSPLYLKYSWLIDYAVQNIFWEGHKILQNLHCRFDWHYIEKIYGEDFAKFCGLLRIYELYYSFASLTLRCRSCQLKSIKLHFRNFK